MKVGAEEYDGVDATEHNVYVDYPFEDWMRDDILEAKSVVDEVAEVQPGLPIIEGRWVEDRVVEYEFAELHELVDLLSNKMVTMVWLLLSSSFKQISVMYSTYLIFLR